MVDFAKQTGDYAVLSTPDMHVLALTYALEVELHGTWRIRDTVGGKTGQQLHEEKRLQEKEAERGPAASAPPAEAAPRSEKTSQPAAARPEGTAADPAAPADDFTVVDEHHGFRPGAPVREPRAAAVAEDDEEDDETVGGEWITPVNITQHKNKALGLVVDESQPIAEEKTGRRSRRNKKRGGNLSVACMTGDFAVQNVLLQMGLRLVSVEGMRIERVKSWVLRCHACFKYVFLLTQNMQGR